MALLKKSQKAAKQSVHTEKGRVSYDAGAERAEEHHSPLVSVYDGPVTMRTSVVTLCDLTSAQWANR
jgi:hypothetical protein